jgi:hypothetical protein
MNKRNRLYLIILVVLVLLFVITRLNNRTEKIISFFKFDFSRISSFSLEDTNGRINFLKTGENWQITEPIDYAADDIRVNDLLEKLMTAKTSNLPLAEGETSLANYQLQDSIAVLCSFYDNNGKILDQAYFGNLSGLTKTPARKKGSHKVFLLDQNVDYTMKPDLKNWRNKIIAEVEKESIEKLAILYDDYGYEISRSDTAWVYNDGMNEIILDENNSTLRTIFSALGKITTTQFRDFQYEQYEKNLMNPALEIAIFMMDGSKLYLRIAAAEENNFILQKNDITDHLFIQYESWLKRFQKTADDFKK